MIRLSLGRIGSGKTLLEVRNMIQNKRHVSAIYTNIHVKDAPHVKLLTPDLIIKKNLIKEIKKKDGSVEQQFKKELNIDFWKEQTPPITVVIDEAYTMLNARRSMNTTNIILNSFMAMLRRVLGTQSGNMGELVIIGQRLNQIDVSVRESANQIRYNICHWIRSCPRCSRRWSENSENPELSPVCISCGFHDTKRQKHVIEVFHFEDWASFSEWKFNKIDTFYHHYFIKNISDYFDRYDTLQWDNMFESEY